MSFDIFFRRFVGGETARAEPDTVLAVLELLVRRRQPERGFVEVTTADGGADVYGMDDPGAGLMVNHASGKEIWNLLFELATVAGFVVMPIGCGTCITEATNVADLPGSLPGPITVIHAGADILAAIESS